MSETRLPSTSHKPRVRSVAGPRPLAQRSAATNGGRLFVQGDDNSAWSRYRDLVAGKTGALEFEKDRRPIGLGSVTRHRVLGRWVLQQDQMVAAGPGSPG